tara:strand:- start:978 stop:1817 length:840 start_codon:yes stop_codon:yes gene_type:complete
LKKIIILGGSGFVGKSLKEFIKKKKIRIISYSRSENKNIIKIKKLPKVDLIFYCINNKNINKSLNYFNHFTKLVKDHKKKIKILFLSSGAVYGPRKLKVKFKEKEKINYTKIQNFTGYKLNYAKEKIILENAFKKLAKKGYKVSIGRGFTFYGKNILKYNYAISNIINQIKKKKNIIINNQNTFRSYMHESDMCRWIIKIADSSSTKCPIYNIGSDKIMNLKKVASYLASKNNVNVIIKKDKRKLIDFYVPSTSLAKRNLKLKTTINFKDAIKLLINKL